MKTKTHDSILVCALVLLFFVALLPGGRAAEYALDFDGTNDYVSMGPASQLGAAAFTLEVWFMRQGTGIVTSTGTGGITNGIPLVTKGRGQAENSNLDMNYFLGIRAHDGVLAADFEEGAGGASPGLNHPVFGVSQVVSGTWNHAAATYDGTNWSLYLNGQLETTLAVGQPPRSDSIQHAGLGSAMTSAGAAAGYFNGVLDEARIWNHARTQLEIQGALRSQVQSATGLLGRYGLNEGAGTIASNDAGAYANGTNINGAVWVAGYPFSEAGIGGLLFDGLDDFVTFGPTNALGLTNFTLECWIKRKGAGVGTSTGAGGIASAVPLITKGRAESDGSNLDMNYFLGIDSVSGVLVADFEDIATGGNHPVTGSTVLALNTWQHVAVTYDGTTMNLYVNGVPDGSASPGQTPRSDSIQHAGLGTAMTSTGARSGFFQGLMDEVRIWNYARSSLEISTAMTQEVATAESGLVARYAMNQEFTVTCTNSISAVAPGALVNGPVWVTGSTFVVTVPLLPPTCSITNPVDGATYNQPGAVTIQAEAGDVDGVVTSVQFFVDGQFLAEDTASPYSVDWSGVSVGPHTVAATAYDDDGQATPSAAVGIYMYPAAGSGGLYFDGVNDYVTFGNNSALGQATFTIETWFKRTGNGVSMTTGTGGLPAAIPLVTKGRGEADGTNVDMNYFLGIRATDGVLVADFEEGAGGSSPGLNHPVIGTTPVTSNTWHHAAATYDGSTWNLYLDGQLDASLPVGQPVRSDSIQHAALASALTSAGTPSGYFSGILDESRIWNYARSHAQISNSAAYVVLAAPGLVARWSLDEGSGSTASNSAGGVVDGVLTSGPVWVAGTALTLNTAPTAFDDPVTMDEDASFTTNVVANDSDAEGNLDTNSVAVISGPAFGTITTNAAGVFTYSPAANYHGSDTFAYEIRDLVGAIDTGDVTITVSPLNDPPVASNSAVSVQANAATLVAATGGDVDGDPLTFTLLNAPANGLVSGFNASNGLFTLTPVHAFSGADVVNFEVSDGSLTSSTAQVSITVLAPPDSDDDGMPDAFESLHGVSDPGADADNDGKSNIEEYWSDTDPTNEQSVLKITVGAGIGEGGPLSITWQSVGGVRYRVAFSDGSANGGFDGPFQDIVRTLAEEVDGGALHESSTQSYTDDYSDTTNPPIAGRYFQIKAVR